jgi:hypothetical protein
MFDEWIPASSGCDATSGMVPKRAYYGNKEAKKEKRLRGFNL